MDLRSGSQTQALAPGGSDGCAATIYSESYAAQYPSLYLTPWRRKHELNLANLARVLDSLAQATPVWLDLACGQAWHFAQFPGRARMVGLDLSPAQIARARRNATEAAFVCGDVSRAPFPPASFDLVTNFWAGYCYLASSERIASMVHGAVDRLRPGGALYMEILLPRDLEAFNASRFAAQTGFAVIPLSDDYTEWRYDDSGGRHVMTSPPIELFLDIIRPEFNKVEVHHDGAFMAHLIATGRRP
jgi:SAM-dependent methyltransferase